jgi:putative ABC transport system substrate-binding protein
MNLGPHADGRDQVAWTRRRVLHDSVAVAGVGILTGCGCAPQRPNIPTVGFVNPGAADMELFLQQLRALGNVEGKTVTIELRTPAETTDELTPVIEELVRLPANIIVVLGSTAAQIAKAATRTIPVVFWGVTDAIRLHLVTSLARPEANVTGVTNFSADVVGKGLEFLLQIVPGVARVAFVGNLKGNPGVLLQLEAAQATAGTIGVQIIDSAVSNAADIDSTFASFPGRGVKAVMAASDGIMNRNRQKMVDTAARYRLPAIYPRREFADAGGLIGYGPSYPALQERLAVMVDKILHGKAPADLPVEQPKYFDLVPNLRTAEALGMTFPPTILALATDVIR